MCGSEQTGDITMQARVRATTPCSSEEGRLGFPRCPCRKAICVAHQVKVIIMDINIDSDEELERAYCGGADAGGFTEAQPQYLRDTSTLAASACPLSLCCGFGGIWGLGFGVWVSRSSCLVLFAPKARR